MSGALAWPFDPSVYAGLAIICADYVLLARGRGWRARHGVWFGLGVLAIWVALETPVDTLGDRYLQSVHMLQHVLLLVVAPPLLLLGLSPAMARAVAGWPGVRPLVQPWPAILASSAVMLLWHLPPLYDATLRSEAVHVLEHLTFTAAGVVFWWPALRSTSAAAAGEGGPLGEGWRLVYLFAGTLPQDALALPLIFSHAVFYDFYAFSPRVLGWLTPIVDQDLAGVVMMVLAKVSILIAMLTVFFRWVAREQAGPASQAGASREEQPGRQASSVRL